MGLNKNIFLLIYYVFYLIFLISSIVMFIFIEETIK